MKINPINFNAKNNNLSFKRAFQVNLNSLSYSSFANRHDSKQKNQTPADDIVSILRNKPTENYDEKTSKKIAKFLKSEIKDTDSKQGGVFSRVIGGRFYIFTGKEAQKAREIIAQSLDCDNALLEMVEDGQAKPHTKLDLELDENNKIKEIYYHYFYSNYNQLREGEMDKLKTDKVTKTLRV